MVGKVVASALKNADDLVSVGGAKAIRATRQAMETTTEKAAKKAVKSIESKASSTYQAKLGAVHDRMRQGIHSGNDNVVDIIETSTGIKRPRRADGTVKNSARKSASVFNDPANRSVMEANSSAADVKLKDIRAREAADREKLGNAIGHMRDHKLANEMADSYGRGQGNKANRRIAEMRKAKELEQQINVAADAEDLDKMLSLQEQLDAHNKKQASAGKSFQDRKAERSQRNAQEQAIAQERRANRKIAESYDSGASESVYGAGAKVDPAAKNNSAEKATLQDKLKANNTVYNIAAMGVGGGLVLNMFNNRGQQSNAQLYGQGY